MRISFTLRILILLILPVLFGSCERIEDVYRYDNEEVADWSAVANKSTQSLIQHFWREHQGYFNYSSVPQSSPEFQYWPQAHAMDVVIDAYLRTGDAKYASYFDKWYDGIRVANGGTYYNRFNDDMEWIALTMLRLHEATKDTKYLNTAQELWSRITSFWNDDYALGGIAWTSEKPWSKNACANAPAAILAIRLYRITGEETYKDWALKIYEWQRETLFDKATGAVFDNIDGRSLTINRTTLSYNQGTHLGAAFEIYRSTHDPLYLKDARKAALYAISNPSMIDTGTNILRNEGMGDGALFKGILIRYLTNLLAEPDLDSIYRKKISTFLRHNAEVLWQKGTDRRFILVGPDWNKPELEKTQLTAQTSGATLFEMTAKLTH